MSNKQLISVAQADVGKRLDLLLAEQLPQITRSAAQKIIEQGLVTKDGVALSKKEKLRAGDQLSVELPDLADPIPQPEDIPLDILYEDDHLLVVNKPKGMVVHPAAGNWSGTLVNALLSHCGDCLSDRNGENRPGILHRIDKNTSGLLLVSKTNQAYDFLSEQVKAHTFTREYRAILHGVLKEDEGTWNFPIGRHKIHRKKMAVGGENPREAITHFRVFERYPRFTEVCLRLETGRTHQIRVHSAHCGYPVAGDEVYGPKKVIRELNGQCLHAVKLGFIHPITNDYMEFTSDLPDYFLSFRKKAKNWR